jgi:hypothetical protein
MKLFFTILIALVSSSTAFADSASSFDVGLDTQASVPTGTSEVVGYDAVLDQGARTFAVEVGLQSIGDYGNQSERNFSSGSNRSIGKFQATDGMLSLTIRKSFSTNFDLSLSGTVLSATPYSSDPNDNGNQYTRVSIHPISLGARYHLSYFADSIMPFAQVDFGEALINESDYFTVGTGSSDQAIGTDDRTYFRPFAKVAVGSDFFVAPKVPVYVGVKVGYLVMSEFGGFTTGVDVGYAF